MPQNGGPGVFVTKPPELIINRGLQWLGELVQRHEMVCLRMSQDGMFRIRVPDERQQVFGRQTGNPLRDLFGVILR